MAARGRRWPFGPGARRSFTASGLQSDASSTSEDPRLLYVVLVLPYAYRALDAGLSAIDVTTLAEAARSLGAGWATVIVRVVVPNMTTALLSAAFISIALVLGEFTFASLLNYDTLQVAINLSPSRTRRSRSPRRWPRSSSRPCC